MTTVAFIPARGGSQRIPRKNLARVGGITLLERAILCAQEAGCDRVVVSTDDAQIADVARAHGCETPVRPAELAGPHAQIEDAIAHWLEAHPLAPSDVIALLQPTSPFRRPETVRECVSLARQYGAALTVTACPGAYFAGDLDGSWPDRNDVEVSWRHSVDTRPRSQDLAWVRQDGVCWAFTVEHFAQTGCRMKRRARVVVTDQLEAFEVDDELDLRMANALASVADGRAA